MNIKKIAFFLNLFLFCNENSPLEFSQNDASTIMMRQNLSLYPYQEPDWPSNDVRFSDFLAFIIDMHENLQENVLRRTVFKMFQRYLENHSISYTTMITDGISWKDLSVFCGQTDELHYLANIVDRTQTIFGKINSYALLALPTSDKQEFLKRQAIVSELLSNENLYNQIRKELQLLASVQNNVITMWINDPFVNASKRKYFNLSPQCVSDYCNENSLLLNVRSILDHKQRAIVAAATVVAAVILPIYGLSKISNYDVLPTKIKNMSEHLFSSGGPVFGLIKTIVDNRYMVGSLAIGSGIVNAMYAKESVEWACDNFVLDQCVYEKMKNIATSIKSLKNIYKILKENESLQILLSEEYEILKNLFENKNIDKDLTNFISLILSNGFKDNNQSFLNNTGNALVAFKLCASIKDHLEEPLMAIGKIDAFVGITTLYKEHQNSSNPYCFATCLESESPCLNLTEFWNPCIKADTVVSNSISLGLNNSLHMIITGPNAGGKSTLLKGIATAIILTQGFGITPAQQANVTLFSLLLTYLNIVDDLSGGNSLFKNQVLRMQKIFGAVRSLENNQTGLILLDEMFNGTSPKEAESCAYGVAHLLGRQNNIINIIATHHQILTNLPNVVNNYKNYHVSVNKQADGSLSYPFKIESGVSSQHIALDILINEGFNNAIITEAKKLLNMKD